MTEQLPALEAYIGDTTTFPVAVTEDGVAYPITGHTLSWLVSATRAGPTLLQVDVVSHTDAANGLSAFTLSAANLTTIGGAGSYYVTGIDVNGTEITWVVATLTVIDRAQRA